MTAVFRRIPCRIHGTPERTDQVLQHASLMGVYPVLTGEMVQSALERFQGGLRALVAFDCQ